MEHGFNVKEVIKNIFSTKIFHQIDKNKRPKTLYFQKKLLDKNKKINKAIENTFGKDKKKLLPLNLKNDIKNINDKNENNYLTPKENNQSPKIKKLNLTNKKENKNSWLNSNIFNEKIYLGKLTYLIYKTHDKNTKIQKKAHIDMNILNNSINFNEIKSSYHTLNKNKNKNKINKKLNLTVVNKDKDKDKNNNTQTIPQIPQKNNINNIYNIYNNSPKNIKNIKINNNNSLLESPKITLTNDDKSLIIKSKYKSSKENLINKIIISKQKQKSFSNFEIDKQKKNNLDTIPKILSLKKDTKNKSVDYHSSTHLHFHNKNSSDNNNNFFITNNNFINYKNNFKRKRFYSTYENSMVNSINNSIDNNYNYFTNDTKSIDIKPTGTIPTNLDIKNTSFNSSYNIKNNYNNNKKLIKNNSEILNFYNTNYTPSNLSDLNKKKIFPGLSPPRKNFNFMNYEKFKKCKENFRKKFINLNNEINKLNNKFCFEYSLNKNIEGKSIKTNDLINENIKLNLGGNIKENVNSLNASKDITYSKETNYNDLVRMELIQMNELRKMMNEKQLIGSIDIAMIKNSINDQIKSNYELINNEHELGKRKNLLNRFKNNQNECFKIYFNNHLNEIKINHTLKK